MKRFLSLLIGLAVTLVASAQVHIDMLPQYPQPLTGAEIFPCQLTSAPTYGCTSAQISTFVISQGGGGGGGGGGGSGTVTSVGVTVPPWLTVAGSPITTAGTLAISATTGQGANTFLAAPNGSSGVLSVRNIVAADLPSLLTSSITGNSATTNSFLVAPAQCSSGQFATGITATGVANCGTPVGSGTVSSVALAMPSIFGVAGSPITTSGTLTVTANNQTANTVWAGPTSGGAAGPVFRALTGADIPAISLTATGAGGIVASGTAGNIYTSSGVGSAPTWQAPSTLNGLAADSSLAQNDLVLVYSQAAVATESATVQVLAAAITLPGTTAGIGGGSLANGACATGTVAVANSTTSMAVAVAPGGGTQPGAGFTWDGYVSANGTVTVRVCNATGATNTPTSTTYNVRVIQ